MELFDDDPAYRQLKKLRDSGYDGPADRDGRPVTTGRAAEILAALRERSAK
ncbi:hypothetical protein GCM10017673_46320 [Streptosporangium violaceochromogenes]|nr:hypothetical protein GCM10017673_46320 [Streptosporangium violaceochromogenes]